MSNQIVIEQPAGRAHAASNALPHEHIPALTYRPEIDGLRAAAVVPVILFHAGVPLFGGGYVGVDVFFVISGFLITRILTRELQEGNFSIARFYERRARRILPALFFVMLCCLPFGWLWMLPDDLENLGQSIAATILFSNNILLTITTDYWSLASEFKPLLHTWSLAVEEQYYIILPLVLSLLWRVRRHWTSAVLGVLLLASFSAAAVAHEMELGKKAAAGVFYLLPTRAWELLIGAIAALIPASSLLPNRRAWRDGLAGLGLVLILIAVFLFKPETPSPSVWTLIPTLGAALLLLFADSGNATGRLLSTRMLVGIGLISYSAYLWHQPILAFMRVYATTEPGDAETAAAVLLTFIASGLTWRFVEQPFRSSATVPTTVLVTTTSVVALTLLTAGLAMNATRGFPERLTGGAEVPIRDLSIAYNERAYLYKDASFVAPDRIQLLVVGNSFARDLINMILETLPLGDVELVYRDDVRGCFMQAAPSNFWESYKEADVILFSSDITPEPCVLDDLARAEADGKHVFITGPKDFGFNLNWVVRLSPFERGGQFNEIPEGTVAAENWMASTLPPANYISLLAAVAVDGRIPITDAEGNMLSPDRKHLTRFGAIYFGERILLGSRLAEVLAEERMTTSD